jgi:hypothetical protein
MKTSIEMTKRFEENFTIYNLSLLSLKLISCLWELSASRRAFKVRPCPVYMSELG